VIDIGCLSFRADARECLPMAHPPLSTRQRHVVPADMGVCSKTSPTAAASGASGARPLEGIEP
jgi:hypothetical protein